MVFVSALCLTALTNSCSDESKLIEELELANVLTPTSTSASISTSDGYTTTFSWSSSSTATQYCLEIYSWEEDSAPASASEITETWLDGLNAEKTLTVPQGDGNTTSYAVELTPDLIYYARVKGQNPGYQGDSHWATFRYPIEPALVMELIESFELYEKTSTSITVAWTIAEDDEDGINQIRISPDPDDPDSSYKAFKDINQDDGSYTIEGLSPSTQYKVSANYGGTARGTVVAYTRPDVNAGAVTVSDSTKFVETILEWEYDVNPSVTIQVEYTGETINLPTIPVLGELTLIGLETASGDKPVLNTNVSLYPAGSTYELKNADGETVATIEDAPGATKLRVEGLKFYGDAYGTNNAITTAGDFTGTTPVTVEVVNCDFESYACGIFYDGNYTLTYGDILIEGVYASDTKGDGGDFIDIRKSSASSLTLKNSTFTDGCRSFIRFDNAGNSIGTVTITNNTINNVCTSNNSNNKGLLHIRGGITGDYELSNNLFLNNNAISDYTVLIYQETDYHIPNKVSNNWYYNNNKLFFYDEDNGGNACKEFSQANATAGGGSVLSNDPCYNSERGNFYVTNSNVINAKAGDPRWFGDYIPEPEAELEVVDEDYEWDLTDDDVFYGSLDESTTKGNLRFIINGTTIKFADDGFNFTGKSSLITTTGIPTDCAIAFLVNQPGSVVLSTSGSNNTNLTVSSAYYDADPDYLSTYKTSVAGSVPSNVDNEYVAALDIPESGEDTYVVYVYASDAITMTGLKWLPMTINTSVTPLPAPTNLNVSPAEADESVSSVTVKWDAVINATYTVYLDGTAVESGLTDTTYELSISGVEADGEEHEVAVQANYAGTLGRGDSELSDPVTFVKSSSWAAVSSTETTTWGSDVWEDISTTHGTVSGGTWLYTDNKLFIDGTSKDFTFASDSYGYYTKISGSGSETKDNIQFKVKTNGTFTFTTLSGNADENSRYAKVYVGGEQILTGKSGDGTPVSDGKFYCPGNTNAPGTYTVDVSGISEETVIAITSGSGGILFYELSWTPVEGAAPDGCVPNDQVTEWASDEFAALWLKYDSTKDAVKENFDSTDGLLHFMEDGSGSGFKFGTGALDENTSEATRFQFAGGGNNTGKCETQFHVSTDGTIKFTIISSGSTARYANVSVGETVYKGEEQTTPWLAASTDDATYPTEYSFNVTGISGDTVIHLYSASGGINCFGIKWVPEGVTE